MNTTELDTVETLDCEPYLAGIRKLLGRMTTRAYLIELSNVDGWTCSIRFDGERLVFLRYHGREIPVSFKSHSAGEACRGLWNALRKAV